MVGQLVVLCKRVSPPLTTDSFFFFFIRLSWECILCGRPFNGSFRTDIHAVIAQSHFINQPFREREENVKHTHNF